MGIDENINAMFNEKNQALFCNKLGMDIDNNADTFKLATKNIVMIEIAKLLSSLKRVYGDYSVELDDDKVKDLLSGTKNVLLEDIYIIIDDKAKSNKDYIDEHNTDSIDSKYVKKFHKHIDDSETSFEDALSLSVKEHAEVDLCSSLLALYPCADEDMHGQILELVNIKFGETLINRIASEGVHRNLTLKNMTDETYRKYLELNKNMVPASNKAKVKTKKEDSNN